MEIIDTYSVSIHFNSGRYKDYCEFIDTKEKLDFILKEIGNNNIPKNPNNDREVFFYDLRLNVDSDRYIDLKKNLICLADNWAHFYDYKFSKEEFKKALLFIISMEDVIKNKKSPSILGTNYKYKCICSACNLSEIVQTSELFLDTNVMKKNDFIYQPIVYKGGEVILVSETLLNEFLKNDINDFKYRPVIHIGKKENEVKTYQIISENVLPPVVNKYSNLENTNKDYCPKCNITGRIMYPINYKYEDIETFRSFNHQYEKLNLNSVAVSQLVVSAKVKSILERFRTNTWYMPGIVV